VSIVEVLVALVLLAVGLLGVAGNGAIAVRASAGAARERRAAQRAADRLAALREQGCAAARSGALVDPAAAAVERWTVGAVAGGATLVDVEVRWRAPGGQRVLLLRGGVLC
jgi:Tfp pilus assembly protein PilV